MNAPAIIETGMPLHAKPTGKLKLSALSYALQTSLETLQHRPKHLDENAKVPTHQFNEKSHP